MPITIAMYDKSLHHIGSRLEALGLDINVVTFDKAGRFTSNGAVVAAQDLDIDFMWLSSHITADGFQEAAFDLVLGCHSVKVLQTFNAGLDDPFYRTLTQRGTRICNSSAQGVAIAEFVMAQVLALVHPIERQRALQAQKKWEITPYREISQTHWLIVGFGAIGREIATRVKAFGATTAVVRRTPETSALADHVGTLADLKHLLPAADIVVLACSLNEETRGLVDAEFFAALKPGAILVNIARGALIEDRALIAALEEGLVANAILDVFATEPLPEASPFWSHPKVRLTSHTSFAGSGVRARWDQLFLDTIVCFANGRALPNEVNPRDLR